MNMKNSVTPRLAFLGLAEYNRLMTNPDVVPDDADEDFDPGYEPVEDPHHGDEELGDVPDEEVNDLG